VVEKKLSFPHKSLKLILMFRYKQFLSCIEKIGTVVKSPIRRLTEQMKIVELLSATFAVALQHRLLIKTVGVFFFFLN